MLRAIIPAALFIVLAGFLWIGLYKDPSLVPSPLIGKPVPEFTLSTLKDPTKNITQADLAADYALINVWATWCPTCLSEHEQLMQIAASTDVVIVGVNYKDQPNKAKQWLAQYGNPYRWVLDDRDGLLGIEMGVYGAPETFLLDAQGDVIYKRVGDINPRIWRDELAPRFRQLGIAMAMGNTDVGANK